MKDREENVAAFLWAIGMIVPPILKACGVLHCSWLWATFLIWMPVAACAVTLLAFFVMMGVWGIFLFLAVLDREINVRRRKENS